MKRIISSLMLVMMLVLVPVVSFAAPSTLPLNVSVASTGIITVTNPPSFTSTTQKGVVFCGYGAPGTKVTIYEYNAQSGAYKQIANSSVTVSSSGVFWKKIDFTTGYHKVIVYAENGNTTQAVKREITVLSPTIKGYTLNIKRF